jgi:hypothetical protein
VGGECREVEPHRHRPDRSVEEPEQEHAMREALQPHSATVGQVKTSGTRKSVSQGRPAPSTMARNFVP